MNWRTGAKPCPNQSGIGRRFSFGERELLTCSMTAPRALPFRVIPERQVECLARHRRDALAVWGGLTVIDPHGDLAKTWNTRVSGAAPTVRDRVQVIRPSELAQLGGHQSALWSRPRPALAAVASPDRGQSQPSRTHSALRWE